MERRTKLSWFNIVFSEGRDHVIVNLGRAYLPRPKKPIPTRTWRVAFALHPGPPNMKTVGAEREATQMAGSMAIQSIACSRLEAAEQEGPSKIRTV